MSSTLIELYNGEVQLQYLEMAKKHRYLVNGKEKKGVTTILGALAKPALMLWPLNEAMKHIRAEIGLLYANDETDIDTLEKLFVEAERAYIRKGDKGKDIGTEVHQKVEEFLRNRLTDTEDVVLTGAGTFGDLPIEVSKATNAFKDWYTAQEDIKTIAVEEIVYSLAFDYCGKFDCLLMIDGQTVLCDLKTTNSSRVAPLGIYSENFLQLGAYASAYEEEKEREFIDDLMVINCSKQGKVSTLRASELGLSKNHCINGFTDTLNMFRFMNETNYKIKNYKENPEFSKENPRVSKEKEL